MHFEQPKVALKLENPQIFRVAGRSQATHARVALMVCQTKKSGSVSKCDTITQ